MSECKQPGVQDLAYWKKLSEDQGLVLATLCDMVLGASMPRDSDTLIKAVGKLPRSVQGEVHPITTTMNPIPRTSPDNGSPPPKNTLPFNLADALAGKPCVHADGSKLVQIFHADRIGELCDVLAVFEAGDYCMYTQRGNNGEGLPALFMVKES